ncbi:MAG TPA: tetratricopeptide repeat protein [Phycisphaerae bacterium]|jgi:tetratricopeptide (TPR) repeat protein
MQSKKIYRLLMCAVVAGSFSAGLGGCEAEHKKYVEASKEKTDWENAQLGIMFQVAEQEYKTGELDKCRESLKSALAAGGKSEPIQVLAAKVEMEGGSLDDAVTHLKKAIGIKPGDPEPYYLMGVVYQRTQKFEEAADYYDQASEKNATDSRYILAAAEMKISLGHLDEAKQYIEDRIGNFEQSAALRVALAKVATLKGDAAGAAKYYRDATMLMPEDRNLRFAYASALFDAGKYSDTSKILEDLRNDPPLETTMKDGKAKSDEMKQADAETAASAKSQLLMMLGEAYVNLKRPLDARDCFQEVVRAHPNSVSAYISLGKTCLLTNELNITTATAQKVLRLEPDNVDAMILIAVVQQKDKRWDEALDTLSQAAKLRPSDTTVICMQGICWLQMGKKDAAETFFTRAVAMNPADTWANSLLNQVKPAAPAPIPAVGPTEMSKPAAALPTAEMPRGAVSGADIAGIVPGLTPAIGVEPSEAESRPTQSFMNALSNAEATDGVQGP